jgi:hypothetical protein
MHNIILSADDEMPDYLEILRDKPQSQFSDDEFCFIDPRLNRLLLDPDGIQLTQSQTTLQVCHPYEGYLPRSLMPRYALANQLYRGHLPEDFQDLMWIEERVCSKYTNTAAVTRLYQSSDHHNRRCGAVRTVNLRSFLKAEEGNPFYVMNPISKRLYPNFRGLKTQPGVVHTERQRGGLLSFLRSIARRLIAFQMRCGRSRRKHR